MTVKFYTNNLVSPVDSFTTKNLDLNKYKLFLVDNNIEKVLLKDFDEDSIVDIKNLALNELVLDVEESSQPVLITMRNSIINLIKITPNETRKRYGKVDLSVWSSITKLNINNINLSLNVNYNSDISRTCILNSTINFLQCNGSTAKQVCVVSNTIKKMEVLTSNLSNSNFSSNVFDSVKVINSIMTESYHRNNTPPPGFDYLSCFDSCIMMNNICPEEGEFVGWKKCVERRRDYKGMLKSIPYLVKLTILADAKRSSGTELKCRCDKARVDDIIPISYFKEPTPTSVQSNYDSKFVYTIGEIVEVPDFDNNPFEICSTGIHFFMKKQEAIEYASI